MRNQQAAVCGTTAAAAVTWKYGKFAYLHQDGDRQWRLTTDWTLTLLGYLGGFIFGKGSGMVSCLAKRVKYQLLQGETILELLYA